MPFTVSLIPDSEPWKSREFVDKNYKLLARLYPSKWIVIFQESVLFACESFDELQQKASSLGMQRGTYSYKFIPPLPNIVSGPEEIDGIGV